MLTLKYQLKLTSGSDLNDLKQRILIILQKKKYWIVRDTYNTIAFDNGIYQRWNPKVNKGEFSFIEEDNSVVVIFNYEISYALFLAGLVISLLFGFFISPNFFYLSAGLLISWPYHYFTIKFEAEELLNACKSE